MKSDLPLQASGAAAADYDAGLRSFMLGVYNHMMAGLGVTGIVAFMVAASPDMMAAIHGSPLKWVVMLAPLAGVLVLSFGIHRMSLSTARTVFYGYAGAMGLSLSYIAAAYAGADLARAFFITAGAFAGLSLYGYTTRRDLTAMGAFLVIGLVGLILASVVNLFVGSTALEFALSVISVLIFGGLTAWDTQKLKESYAAGRGAEDSGKLALMGALSLYLDFINLFISILRLTSSRD